MTKDDAWNLVDMMHAYFDERSDIKDGDHGEQKPNNEMRFAMGCQELLEFLEALDD